VRGAEDDGATSSLGSPKQHQGQEEENAGRASPAIDDGDAPVGGGGGGGGDYFGDLTEVDVVGDDSSVDEDMSFEQESADSDGGDDYFSWIGRILSIDGHIYCCDASLWAAECHL